MESQNQHSASAPQKATDAVENIINHYYAESPELRRILLKHSRCVADKALDIARRHPELNLNEDFLEAAAMLHDIGIIRCDAPSICCHGSEHYICHGREGAKMLRVLSGTPLIDDKYIEPLARICERHTGAGLSRAEILAQNLPLPAQDFLPETTAEQVVCYADKFFSKTHLDHEKTVEEAARSLKKFGSDGLSRFTEWVERFE